MCHFVCYITWNSFCYSIVFPLTCCRLITSAQRLRLSEDWWNLFRRQALLLTEQDGKILSEFIQWKKRKDAFSPQHLLFMILVMGRRDVYHWINNACIFLWGEKDVHSFARRKKDKRADPWDQQTCSPFLPPFELAAWKTWHFTLYIAPR